MKVIILAAGRGERMRPLTDTTPKPLLKVNGTCLIDYVLYYLPRQITEIIIVVDYLGDQIKNHVGKIHDGLKVTYVQGSSEGNAFSFLATKSLLKKKEKFMVIYGDEMPNAENMEACVNEDLCVLTYDGGKVDGVMVLNTDIFNYKSEEDFVTMVEQFLKDHFVTKIRAKNFVGGINTPKDIKRVEKALYEQSINNNTSL